MYGRAIEIHVKGGGKLNTIPFNPTQPELEKRYEGDKISYNKEGAINHAKRLISRWYACDRFADKQLKWRVS